MSNKLKKILLWGHRDVISVWKITVAKGMLRIWQKTYVQSFISLQRMMNLRIGEPNHFHRQSRERSPKTTIDWVNFLVQISCKVLFKKFS